MNKPHSSSSIGQALTRTFILYSCLKKPKSGYNLLSQGKEIFLTNWSAGSFYPHLRFLLNEKLLTKKNTGSKRITYEYYTTRDGVAYLNHISTYFKHPSICEFFNALISGDFNETVKETKQ